MSLLTLKVMAGLLQLQGTGAQIQSDHQGLDVSLRFLGLFDGQINAPELHSGQRNCRLEA